MKRLYLAFAITVAAGTPAFAEWPNDKPIEIIVAFAAGGAQDTLIRALQPSLEKVLGQKVVVSNKPGASGEITYTALTQAKPDGYTFSTLSSGFLTMQLDRKLKFDPKLIKPVARLAFEPSVIAVKVDSPIKTMDDLAKAARAKPGTITWGGSGVGSDEHLAAMKLADQVDIRLKYVPFAGGIEVITALLGGHLDTGGTSANVYKANPGIRPIAVLAEERNPSLPDAPTAKEQGHNVVMMSERGLGTNVNVPQEIQDKFSDAVREALEDPEFKEKLKKLNMHINYMSGREWAETMDATLAEYKALFDKTPWVKN